VNHVFNPNQDMLVNSAKVNEEYYRSEQSAK